MKQVFISHRTDDVFTAKVRTRLVARLAGTNNVEPLYDQDIEPGAEWRPRILNWLRTCDAAVILFSRKALEDSKWVPFETTVLSWRYAVTDRPRLLPVLLGVTDKESKFDTFEPAQLKEVQFVRMDDPFDTSDASADALVDKILAALTPALAACPSGEHHGELARWMRAVSTLLDEFKEEELKEVATGLKVSDQDWNTVRGTREERGPYLAWQLLHADDLLEVRDALGPLLTNKKKRPELRELIDLLRPLWVDRDSARVLHGVTRRVPPDLRNVGLRIEGEFEPDELDEILGHYIVRATCSTSEGAEWFKAPDTCASDEQFKAEFEHRLLRWAMPRYRPVRGTPGYAFNLNRCYSDYVSRKEGSLFVLFAGDSLRPGPLNWCRGNLTVNTFFLYNSDVAEFPLARDGKLRELPPLSQFDAAGTRYADSRHLQGLTEDSRA